MATESESEYWQRVERESVITSIAKLEEAAKQLIGIISLLQGAVFALLLAMQDNLSGFLSQLSLLEVIGLVIPLILWITSIALAANVIVPQRHQSQESIKKRFEDARDDKYWSLRAAYIIFIGSLFVLLFLIVLSMPAYLDSSDQSSPSIDGCSGSEE